jgi:alanine racemase
VACAHAAVRAGAEWLAVATIEEAAELRAARLEVPLLLLSEPRPHELRTAVALACRVVVWSIATVDALAGEARRSGTKVLAHLKVDTGMHRVGANPDDAVDIARHIAATEGVELEALMTHLPVADEPANDFTAAQLARFTAVVDALEAAGLRPPMLHAANSAGAIEHPAARLDLVRCGIAVYGIDPAPALAGRLPLRPAMRLTSSVLDVRRVDAGEGVSYGHRWRAERPTTIATVPMGYADGVPRQLGDAGGEVLIGGTRRRIVGAVTMDQCMVDCDDDATTVGEEVVLLGTQGEERIDPWDWATALGTIAYEITTRIGPRVPRDHVRSTPTL